MILLVLLVLAILFLAYANGANDNFKGVATLYASNTTSFREAITLATIATAAGCFCSVFLAEGLVKAFSGKGLVPDAIAASPMFLMSVAFGAAATVFFATVTGFPISTTHALTGGLAGAGAVAAGADLNLSVLGSSFFLPLLVSPLLAFLLTIPLYWSASRFVRRLGLERETCVCIGPRQFVPVRELTVSNGAASEVTLAPDIALTVASTEQCFEKYQGKFLGVQLQSVVDNLHRVSAAAISFARGLNDTPKIVGLLLAMKALDVQISMVAIAAAMALGGLINSRKVAETMSHRISKMNDGQALSANLVTAGLVIFASCFGLPVSTTHVSVGSISGIGLANGSADFKVISSILASWVLTLPIAALVAAACYTLAASTG